MMPRWYVPIQKFLNVCASVVVSMTLVEIETQSMDVSGVSDGLLTLSLRCLHIKIALFSMIYSREVLRGDNTRPNRS